MWLLNPELTPFMALHTLHSTLSSQHEGRHSRLSSYCVVRLAELQVFMLMGVEGMS